MEAMGPETALLAAAPARARGDRGYAALEFAREDPLYVAAACRASLTAVPDWEKPRKPEGLWRALVRAQRRTRDPSGGREEIVPVTALPAASTAPP